MEINSDGLRGMIVGALTVLFVCIVLWFGSCSKTYTISKPDTKEICVVYLGMIQDCYPAERTGQ